MPPVPITTESLEDLQARYPRALEHVYNQKAIVEQGGIRPGEVAANVFDFPDGLRLIVSRELCALTGEIGLHFSASFGLGSRLADEILLLATGRGLNWAFRQWVSSVPERFRELSGDTREACFLGISAGNVPHWRIEE